MPTIKITPPEEVAVEIENESINVKVTPPKIPVKVSDPNRQVFEFKLNLRRALNGDLMVFDHSDIDIVILLEKKKIVAFAKDEMSDVVYGAENRLFDHLKKRGIVAYDSIQGGNVYGSLEGLLLEAKEENKDVIKYILYEISKWIEKERPHTEALEAHDEMMDDAILNPDEDHSTNLGDVPHAEEKGSVNNRTMWAPYHYGRYTY